MLRPGPLPSITTGSGFVLSGSADSSDVAATWQQVRRPHPLSRTMPNTQLDRTALSIVEVLVVDLIHRVALAARHDESSFHYFPPGVMAYSVHGFSVNAYITPLTTTGVART